MNFWNQMPLVRLLLAFLAGILSAVYLHLSFRYALPFLAATIILAALLSLIKNPIFVFRYNWLNGVIIYTTLFVCGVQLTLLNTQIYNPNHFSHFIEKDNYATIQIIAPTVDKGKSLKTAVTVTQIEHNGKWLPTIGNAMLYIENDSAAAKLKYGDCMIVKAAFREIPGPQNPSEFNYKQYLAFHNINYQLYTKQEAWKNLHLNKGNWIIATCLDIRNYLLNVFIENKIAGDEFAVGSALILGYEDKLNPDIMSAYAASGALHVLSVSGLHIAIIYAVLNMMLFFLEKIKHGKLIKAFLLIILLWFYSALTGLSPSVMRAATMFSFIIMGKTLNRYTNIYNTLAASMLFLLLTNPYLIMEVGFQLSYLAVFGIVAIQPYLDEWYEPRGWVQTQIWSILTVSVAAQLITFPLSLLYFHQFPNYFLISNLVVIPVSSVILYFGMGIFLFSKIKWLTAFLCKILSIVILFLNESVKFCERAPFSVVQGVSITILETWIIYGIIICVSVFLVQQRVQFLKFGLVLTILLLCSLIGESYVQHRQVKFIVYNIKNHSAFDFVNGDKNYFFSDTSLINNKSRMLFHVRHNWWDMGINTTVAEDGKLLISNFKNQNIVAKNSLIDFAGSKFLWLTNENSFLLRKPYLSKDIDFVIVSGNPKIKMKWLFENIKCKKIIFDSTNSNYKIAKWKKECEENKKEYYDVPNTGALVLALND